MKEIVFVTGNKGKQASAQRYFDKNKVEIRCYNFEYDEPDINDIEYIAKCKVLQAYEKIGVPCIALDAGFYIPTFPDIPNFPGAFPKRELLDKIGLEGLMKKMKGVKDRHCYFKECLAYYDGISIEYFYGLSEGILANEVREGNSENKWSDLWYVFIPNNCTKTLAEMNDNERAERKDGHTQALAQFSEWYEGFKILKKK